MTRTEVRKKLTKTQMDFERWYTRLKRAFNQMEKNKQRIVRLQRELDRHDSEEVKR